MFVILEHLSELVQLSIVSQREYVKLHTKVKYEKVRDQPC